MFLLASSENLFSSPQDTYGQPAPPAAFCSHSVISLRFLELSALTEEVVLLNADPQRKIGDSQPDSIGLPLLQVL